MQLLNCNQVGHSFAGKLLFQNVTFGVFEDDKIGLVGPNGVGKTTLLKILLKNIMPDKGDVTWNRGLNISYLEQSPQFNEGDTIDSVMTEGFLPSDLAHSSVYEWISKAGLDAFELSKPAAELSGGWKKKLALARAFSREPHILILDEPTNHLDIESIIWLEEILQRVTFATIIVTHDRLFLQRVSKKIFDLDPRNPNYLWVFDGFYDQYLEAKQVYIQGELAREKSLKNTLRREAEWLARGAQARQTKQKARILNADVLQDQVRHLSQVNQKKEVQIEFSGTEKRAKQLLKVQGLSKSYDPSKGFLFKDLDIVLTSKSRIGLLGNNGVGKTSLIKILIGLEEPTQGQILRPDWDFKINYFEQDRNQIDLNQSIIKNICPEGDFVHFNGQPLHVRSYLEKFLFFGDRLDQAASLLSGGERARLRIAQIMLHPADLLILDEPTNDLDLETLEVLEEALADYSGAVLLVSHDRFFMDSVCDQIISFPFGPKTQEAPKLEFFSGYFQWEKWWRESKTKQGKSKSNSANSNSSESVLLTTTSPLASVNKSQKKMSYKEQKELDTIESEILGLEGELHILQNEGASLPEDYNKMAQLQSLIEKRYERWAELEKKKKSITS